MTTNRKSQGKQRFLKPVPVAEAAPVVQEIVVQEIVVEAMVVEEAVVVAAEAAPVAAFEPAPASVDAAALPLKALDLWSENASACFDFAKALGEAKTPGELMEAQSRFASGRYEAWIRQSNEFAEFAQACALKAGRSAPTGLLAA